MNNIKGREKKNIEKKINNLLDRFEDIDNIWSDWYMGEELEDELEEFYNEDEEEIEEEKEKYLEEECNHDNIKYFKKTDQAICLDCGRIFRTYPVNTGGGFAVYNC